MLRVPGNAQTISTRHTVLWPLPPHSHIDSTFLLASREEPQAVRSTVSPVLSLTLELWVKSSTTEGMIHTAHTLSSTCPNLFLPQEKWVPQAWKALQEQEAPQVLREREVPLVSVESLELRGQQVSDGRSWVGASVFLCPPGVANAYPSTVTPPIRTELTLTGGRINICKEGTSMDSGSTVSRESVK